MSNYQNNQQNNQVQTSRKTQLTPYLVSAQRQIESLLNGDTERAKKFVAASMVVACDPLLNNCEPESIIQSLVGVAMLDLSVDKNIGHCYVVPYGGKAQLQVGYKGMIQLLFRAGWTIKAFPVYNCDSFSMSFDGWDNHVDFVPNIDGREEGDNDWALENLRGIYVVARHSDTKDQYSAFVNKTVVEKLRLNSSNQKLGKYPKPGEKERLDKGLPVGIWQLWYVEMAIGKAIKKLAKTLPIGDERAQKAFIADDMADAGKQVDFKNSQESGMIIELKDSDITSSISTDDNKVQKIVDAINASESREKMDELVDEIGKLSAADKKIITVAWSARMKELKKPVEDKKETKPKDESEQKPVQPDVNFWSKEIADSVDKKSLLNLITTMPHDIELEFSDEIDAAMDLFR